MVPWGRSLLSIQDLVTVFPLAYTSRSSWAKENKKQGLPQLAAYLGRLVTLLTVFEHCFIALLYSPASCGTCYCSPRDFPSPSSYSIGMCEAKARSMWTKSRSADCFVPWLLSQSMASSCDMSPAVIRELPLARLRQQQQTLPGAYSITLPQLKGRLTNR